VLADVQRDLEAQRREQRYPFVALLG